MDPNWLKSTRVNKQDETKGRVCGRKGACLYYLHRSREESISHLRQVPHLRGKALFFERKEIRLDLFMITYH